MSDIKELTVFLLDDIILLRGTRTIGLVNNVTIITKGSKRGLDKLKSIINTKNLRHSGILSDNFYNELDDRDKMNPRGH